MLWRRRNEGFEWREYVRTTVLARRQARRRRLDDARAAAAEQVRAAGRKGLEAGVAGAEAAAREFGRASRLAAVSLGSGARHLGHEIASWLNAMREAIARCCAPLNQRLTAGHRQRWLAAAALAAGFATAVRIVNFGWDGDAAGLAGLAMLIALAAFWPTLFPTTHAYSARDSFTGAPNPSTGRSRGMRQLVNRETPWPSPSRLSAGAGLTVLALVVWYAWPAWKTPASPPSSQTAGQTLASVAAKNAESDWDFAGKVRGRARADGPGTLRVGGRRVALAGLIALHPRQTCQRSDGSTWGCGKEAAAALDRIVRRVREVVCTPTASDREPIPADCEAAGRSIAAQLIAAGPAFADGWLWPRYRKEESLAREASRGLWRGEPERPDAWAQRMWDKARSEVPGGCPIKGVILGPWRRYVTPIEADYASTEVRENRGGRWFCSPEDAEAAGFSARPAS